MRKTLSIGILASLLLSLCMNPQEVNAHCRNTSASHDSIEAAINVDLVQRYISDVETSNNDITYYMLAIFDQNLSKEQKEQYTDAIQEKIRGLEADNIELSRSIKIDDYSCQTCQLLTTLSISLQHNRNAFNELLSYMNSTNNSNRLDSLERFFFAKTSSYQNLDWVKRILANN